MGARRSVVFSAPRGVDLHDYSNSKLRTGTILGFANDISYRRVFLMANGPCASGYPTGDLSMILALLLDYLSCALWSSRIASDDITTTQTQHCQPKTPSVAKSNLGP